MAPKSKKAAAKAKAKAVVAPVPRTLQSNSNLVEAHTVDEAAASRAGRQLRRRTSGDQVDKSVNDNLKGFSRMQTDVVIVEDALTAREIIARDRTKRKGGESIPMGQPYYRALRAKIEHASGSLNGMVVKNKTEPVRNELIQVIVDAQSQPRNFGPLTEWCRRQTALTNQREMVGFCNMQKSLRPQGSPPQTQMALDMMRYVQRTGMHTTFADEANQMRPTYMVALEESFVAFKTKKLGLLLFWSAHEEILGLCLPMVELRKLFAAEGKWSTVAHELAVVAHSCSLGKKMFGFAQDKMVADLKNDAMAAFSDRLFNANTLDQKTFSEACDACNVQLDGIIGL
jgi:hypothetical protein